jgi:transposase
MSRAFQNAVDETFENASQTVDWFHVVQLFTDAVESVRRSEAKQTKMPKGARWATVKGGDGPLKDRDRDALAELERLGLATGEAYKIKEKLRWVRKAATPQAARWRLTRFLNHADEMAAGDEALAPVRKAIATVRQQIDRIIQRWYSVRQESSGRRKGGDPLETLHRDPAGVIPARPRLAASRKRRPCGASGDRRCEA